MAHKGGDLAQGSLHLVMKGRGGHPQRAVTQNNDLHQAVRGSDPDAVFLAQTVGGLFNIGVGGLRLFGVDNGNIVVLLNLFHAAMHFIGVKDQNDPIAPIALIVT